MHVTNDANDVAFQLLSTRSGSKSHVMPDRICPPENFLGRRFTDQQHLLRTQLILFADQPPADERNLHCLEIPLARNSQLRAVRIIGGIIDVHAAAELKSAERKEICGTR